MKNGALKERVVLRSRWAMVWLSVTQSLLPRQSNTSSRSGEGSAILTNRPHAAHCGPKLPFGRSAPRNRVGSASTPPCDDECRPAARDFPHSSAPDPQAFAARPTSARARADRRCAPNALPLVGHGRNRAQPQSRRRLKPQRPATPILACGKQAGLWAGRESGSEEQALAYAAMATKLSIQRLARGRW